MKAETSTRARTHPLWDELIARRDAERARTANSFSVVKGDDLDYELTPLGYLKWYLHPGIEGPTLRSMLFHEQMIPPGSRSATVRHPGGTAHLIVEGHGQVIVDGEAHEFWAADVVVLPVTGTGITLEIVNLERDAPVRLTTAMPNLVEALGVDMGAEFEVLEPAPEYEASGA